MIVKHKETEKEYKVHKIEKQKHGTYILIYRENKWVWDYIDSYEPVPETIYIPSELLELKSAEQSNEEILKEIKNLKITGGL